MSFSCLVFVYLLSQTTQSNARQDGTSVDQEATTNGSCRHERLPARLPARLWARRPPRARWLGEQLNAANNYVWLDAFIPRRKNDWDEAPAAVKGGQFAASTSSNFAAIRPCCLTNANGFCSAPCNVQQRKPKRLGHLTSGSFLNGRWRWAFADGR